MIFEPLAVSIDNLSQVSWQELLLTEVDADSPFKALDPRSSSLTEEPQKQLPYLRLRVPHKHAMASFVLGEHTIGIIGQKVRLVMKVSPYQSVHVRPLGYTLGQSIPLAVSVP